tara:strand:- start:66806 stop:67120 length:315 start_codon:yes stop_codon:yes gene_type:complete
MFRTLILLLTVFSVPAWAGVVDCPESTDLENRDWTACAFDYDCMLVEDACKFKAPVNTEFSEIAKCTYRKMEENGTLCMMMLQPAVEKAECDVKTKHCKLVYKK